MIDREVDADCVKLTTYFGERHRSDGRFLADALLDLYQRREVELSVLMRGALGFGLGQHLRTDRLLTLSEDLPLVSVAVDEWSRIEALAEEVRGLTHSGLVTLERARLLPLTGRLEPARALEARGEQTKLTVYLGRKERVQDRPAFVAVCELLREHSVAGATVLLGVDGTRRGVRHRARFVGANADVPLMLIAVGRGERIARALLDLRELLRDPLVTLERVRVCKRDGRLIRDPHLVPDTGRSPELWQKLMVYSSGLAEHEGIPQHEAIVRRLRAEGVRGATVLRGVWGFHGDHAPHGDRLLQIRRRVPTVTVVVDTPGRIADAFDIIDAATSARGLVTSEIVPTAWPVNAS